MIPLYKPFMPEVPLVDEILHSGKLSYGPYGKAFEQQLCAYLEVNNLIVTNTFSNGISVAVTTLGLKQGDMVIVSPMACLASTQPLVTLGLNVIWADVDPNFGTLDPDSVKNVIKKNPNIKLIIHNHFCGYLGHIDEINSIGKEYGIPVMDDGIEAFGSEYKGKKLGNVGSDITVFSFGAVRIPNTIDGAAVIFKDEALYKKSLLVRDSGINRSIFRDELGEISKSCDISLIGYNAMPNEVQSYIGLQQMEQVKDLLNTQRVNAAHWHSYFENNLDAVPIRDTISNPNYWVYGILCKDKVNAIKSFRAKGLHASSVHINNNNYSVFGDKAILPGVSEFYNNFLALPCGWWFNI